MEPSMAEEVFEVKTPEEIKKGMECCKNGECENCRYIDGSGHWSCVGRLINDIFAYIQQLEQRLVEVNKTSPRWISVKERLPEDDGYFLCNCNDGSPDVVCMYYGDGEFLTPEPELSNLSHIITHWMPLPQPPKEET